MNILEKRNVLALRLEDKGANSYSPLFLTDIIELAELELAILLADEKLRELETEETVTISSGVFDMKSLTYQPLKAGNSIITIQMEDGTYAHPLETSDLKQTENNLLRGSDSTPQYYIFDGKIHFLCDTQGQDVTICYLRKPFPLCPQFTVSGTGSNELQEAYASTVDDAYNGKAIYNVEQKTYHIITDYTGSSKAMTTSPAMAADDGDTIIFIDDEIKTSLGQYVNNSLNTDFDDIILLLAEGNAWKKDGYSDRSIEAVTSAYERIKKLNGGNNA